MKRSCRTTLSVAGLLGASVCLWLMVAMAQEPGTPRNIGRSGDLVLLRPLAETAPSGNAALFVGVNDFTKDITINGLQFAVHDAVEQAYLFVIELKLIPAKNCRLLLSGLPVAESVKRHLDELKRAGATVEDAQRSTVLDALLTASEFGWKPSDMLVVGLSSHGFVENDVPYVMPSDGRRRLLSDTAVPLRAIEAKMEESQAGHRLLLVDACQERVSAKGDGIAAKAMNPAFLDVLKQPTGQAKLASCSPGEFSYENASLGGIGHGVFTHSLLEALRGGAKPDEQNLVRLGSVAEYVSRNVLDWTKQAGYKPQSPSLNGPVKTQTLPLASKADDVATLIASVKRQPTSAVFSAELRARLMEQLAHLNPQQEADRELLSATRDFVRGNYPERRFVPYLKEDMPRWRGTTPPLLVAPFTRDQAKAAQQAWAKSLGREVEESNSIGMKLTLIPAGEFLMGSTAADVAGLVQDFSDFKKEFADDEQPQHRPQITVPFYLGTMEVTQGQFAKFVADDDYKTDAERDGTGGWGYDADAKKIEQHSQYTWRSVGWTPYDDSHPVVNVSWNDAKAFCAWLSRQEKKTYRLPTEAEWEYACRAETSTRHPGGDDKSSLVTIGNVGDATYAAKFEAQWALAEQDGWLFTAPVGTFKANGFGVHDMIGNVWELCGDTYDAKLYSQRTGTTTDPLQTRGSEIRVLRGGSWNDSPRYARSACRSGGTPDDRYVNVGFRVVCVSDARTR